jgi:hypothetical protein
MPPDHDIDILRVADGGSIDGGNPRRDGVAAHDRVFDVRAAKGSRSTQQALTHLFYGIHHPLEEVYRLWRLVKHMLIVRRRTSLHRGN